MQKFVKFLGLLLVLASCQNDDLLLQENTHTEQGVVIKTPQDQSAGERSTLSSNQTCCKISGTMIACPNTSGSFTYGSSISNSNITWTVLSGDITLNSSTGNQVTAFFGSNFSGGTIKAFGENGLLECSSIKTIQACDPDPVECPDQSCLRLVHIEQCSDAQAILHCANDVYKVDWEYSIGPYSYVPFATTYNSNGNYTMTVPLYIPSGNWHNYELHVHANITLTDGSTCYRWTKLTLDCNDSGGHQF